jgi:hypothetical protein
MNFSVTLARPTTITLLCSMLAGCILTPDNKYILTPGDTVSVVSVQSSQRLSKRDLFVPDANSYFYELTGGASSGTKPAPESDTESDTESYNTSDVIEGAAVLSTKIAASAAINPIGTAGALVVIGTAVGVVATAIREAGALAVIAVDTAKGVNIDKKVLLHIKMAEYLSKQSTQSGFLDVFAASASEQYDVKPSPTDKTLAVHIDKLEFNSLGDGLVVLKVNATAAFFYTNKTGKKITIHTKKYKYKDKPRSVDLWIGGQDEFYQSKLNVAYQSLSTQILRTL